MKKQNNKHVFLPKLQDQVNMTWQTDLAYIKVKRVVTVPILLDSFRMERKLLAGLDKICLAE